MKKLNLDNNMATHKVKYKRKKYGLDFSESPQIILFKRGVDQYATEVELEGSNTRSLTEETKLVLAYKFLGEEGIKGAVTYQGETVWEAGTEFIKGFLFDIELSEEELPSQIVHEKWQVAR